MQTVITSGLYLAGIFQCLFLLISLPKHRGRLFLIIFLTAITLLLLNYLIWDNRWLPNSIQFPINRFTHSSLTYIIGPCFFFYVKTQFNPTLQFRKRDLWHLFPYIIALIVSLFVFPIYAPTWESNTADWFIPFVVWPQIFRGVHILGYTFSTVSLILREGAIKKIQELIKKILVLILITGSVTALSTTISYLVEQTGVWKLILKNVAIIGMVSSVYLINKLFMSLIANNTTLFDNAENKEAVFADPPLDTKRYQNSQIEKKVGESIYISVDTYIKTSLAFEDPDLTLPKLASALSLSTNKLSQVINQFGKQTFYEYINHYRIEAACTLLTDHKKQYLTIEGIGYQVGFRSKSTYYEAFKKLKGITPKQYKEQNLDLLNNGI